MVQVSKSGLNMHVQTAPIFFHVRKLVMQEIVLDKIPLETGNLNVGNMMDFARGTFTAPVYWTIFVFHMNHSL